MHKVFGLVLVLVLLTFPARGADVQSPPLVVVFDRSGQALPQADIRAAIAKELGRSIRTTPDPELGQITVGTTDGGRIVLSYRPPRGELERELSVTERGDAVPELVGLAAANLVLNSSPGRVTEPRRDTPPATAPAVPDRPTARSWRVGVHAGWWDVGADLLSPVGIFVGLGVPWIVLTPFFAYGGQKGVLTADSRLGYGHPLSAGVTLYGHILTAWAFTWGSPCGDACEQLHEHKFFIFPCIGARYAWRSGVMLGADLPLVGLKVTHSDDRAYPGWSRPEWVPPPISFAFSQAYVGYQWGGP